MKTVDSTSKKPESKFITIDNVTKTIEEWANEKSVSVPTIKSRLKKGLTGEELVKPTFIRITYRNQTKTMREWCDETGVSYHSLYKRYVSGMTGEELFSGLKGINMPPKRTLTNFLKNNPEAQRLHNIWCGMKVRCYTTTNKDYRFYGEQGVQVDEAWRKNFYLFYEWAIANNYDDALTLMRENRNGNYEPDNCKWATWKEQQSTRRNGVLIEIEGITRTIREWSEATGLKDGLIRGRKSKGLTGKALIADVGIQRIEYKGQFKTMSEWAETTGISYGAIYSRYQKGDTLEEIFRPKRKSMKINTLIEINGESRSFREWEKISGIAYGTLTFRFRKGKRGNDLIAPLRKPVFGNAQMGIKKNDGITREKLPQKISSALYGMRRRCFDNLYKDFRYYGAKGISVAIEWQEDSHAFYEWSLSNGYTSNSSLIRKDKKGHFEPSNCIWVEK